MGQIAEEAGKKRLIESPLTIEMQRFVRMTAFIATVTGVVFFVAGMVFVDSDFLTEFVLIIGTCFGIFC